MDSTKNAASMKARLLKYAGLWPSSLETGVRVNQLTEDFRYAKLRFKYSFLRSFYTSNYYGSLLIPLTDSFFREMFNHNLGPNCRVNKIETAIWQDRPRRTDLTAEIEIEQRDIDSITVGLHAIKDLNISTLSKRKRFYFRDTKNQVVFGMQKEIEFIRVGESKPTIPL
jgi:hypothetical protein